MTAPEIRPPAPPDQIVIPCANPNPVPDVDDSDPLDSGDVVTPVDPGDAVEGAIKLVSTTDGSITYIAGPYAETDAQAFIDAGTHVPAETAES